MSPPADDPGRTRERLAAWASRLGPAPGRDGPAPAVPAATVVVLRDGPDGLEALMLRRDARLAFAGGMWVFPGGRVEDADTHADTRDGLGHELAAARRAAVRETAEEAGLVLPADRLVPLSHWVPPPQTPRRYATWFFLAPAPVPAQVRVDGREIREAAWVRPAAALAARDAGRWELTPPTWVTLHWLTDMPSVAAALAAASAREPERFTTRAAVAGDDVVALWAGDAGYDDGDPDRPGPRHRLWMSPQGWRYERHDGAVNRRGRRP